MIRAHEIPNNGRSYWVEESHHQGNGLAVGALSTAIPAAVISLGNFAKEWLGNNKGGSSGAACGNAASFMAALIPTLSNMLGRAVTPETTLSPAEVKFAEQAAEIAMLKSENYSDKGVAELNKAIMQGQKDQYEYSLNLERRIGVQEGELKCLAQRFDDYKIAQAEKAVLEKKVIDGEIARVADSSACLAGQLNQTNQALNNFMSAITKVVVPGSAVCGKTCGDCSGNGQ